MKTFSIKRPDRAIAAQLQDKIDDLTKPKGSLGLLEETALRIGVIQQTLTPTLSKPYNLVFAGDHGIADEGVSATVKEVTRQMVYNFIGGGAGVSVFARQHGIGLKVIDSGVDHDFEGHPELVHKKIAFGTRNFLYEPAMTHEELHIALERGADVVDDIHREGSNVVSFGEMGIGNTSCSSMLMTMLHNVPLEKTVGAGSGLDSKGVQHKFDVLTRAKANYKGDRSAFDIIAHFSGYEMAMITGGMLRAAELGMVILVDGFNITASLMAAAALHPEVLDYCIYSHKSNEGAHKLMLDILGGTPLLQLELRLGEGTGALVAYPILESAICMINNMSSFSTAKVTRSFN